MTTDDAPDDLEFGPGGYLPERASRRARKIVLRAPLGLQWIVGAVVAGILVVVAGVTFLSMSDDGPGGNYLPMADVAGVEHGMVLECFTDGVCGDRDGVGRLPVALVSADVGRIRVFAITPDDDIAWCDASRQFEAADGRAWTATGRGLGTPSLDEHPALVVDGGLWVDWLATVPGPASTDEQATLACR